MKKILTISILTISILTIILSMIPLSCLAKINWIKVPDTNGIYINSDDMVYNKYDNFIVCYTFNQINKDIAIVFREVYFYNIHSNAITAQLNIIGETVGDLIEYPKENVKIEPIKLGSDVEKTYYFVYAIAKSQGKVG